MRPTVPIRGARTVFCGMVAAVLMLPVASAAQSGESDASDREARVANLFETRCASAGCHAGPVPQMGMELTRQRFYASTVGEASTERPELLRVHPGQPELSYLMMKVRGEEGIIGAPMPFTGDPLSEEEFALVRDWIQGIDRVDESRKQDTTPSVVYPFYGWKIVNLPTTRMVDRQKFIFQISHRFNPPLDSGYDAFYGLDGPGVIFLGLGYAVTDELLFTLGRSNSGGNVELQGRYLAFKQNVHGGWPWSEGWPCDVAVHATLNWVTSKPPPGESRWRGDAFKFSAQVTLAREVTKNLGLAVVPGITTNPSEDESGEDPLVTIGVGGRWRLSRNLALIAEWVPITSGYVRTFTFGNDVRFDSWGGGLEIRTTGHVFQIVVSNTVGLATDQYARGGDLDIADGDMRLGFNIFRILNFW